MIIIFIHLNTCVVYYLSLYYYCILISIKLNPKIYANSIADWMWMHKQTNKHTYYIAPHMTHRKPYKFQLMITTCICFIFLFWFWFWFRFRGPSIHIQMIPNIVQHRMLVNQFCRWFYSYPFERCHYHWAPQIGPVNRYDDYNDAECIDIYWMAFVSFDIQQKSEKEFFF